MDLAVRVEELLRDVVESQGFELVHVEYQPKGAASILRVYIDKPGGVNLADCQQVSRQVGLFLDVEDLIPHHYTLEVSSPGIERPLFKRADYERFVGSEIRLATVEKIENRRNFRGCLLGVSDENVDLECGSRVYRIPLAKVKKCNLVYRFD